jgi:type VI protein secretion system component Hcp
MDGPFAGLMEWIMSKTTMGNSDADPKVRELNEKEVEEVSGGKASFHDLSFVHLVDKASPVLMPACSTSTSIK